MYYVTCRFARFDKCLFYYKGFVFWKVCNYNPNIIAETL